MELRHIRYFIAVAEELNFTRAAERLRTAQPSLSQQIRDLEEEVGTPLLERTKRRVALTAAGRAFLDEARLVMAQTQRAIMMARRAAQADQRKLTIGFLPSAEVKIFPSVLSSMRAEFPDVPVELRHMTTGEQRDALANGSIDVGFMRLPVDEAMMVHDVVLMEKLVVVLPADHPLATLDRVPLTALARHPYLRVAPSHAGNLHDITEAYCRAKGVQLRPIQDVENVLTLLTLIGMGLGFGLLPDYAEHLVFKNVTTRCLAEPPPTVGLAMVRRADRDFPALAAFVELVLQATEPV
ncbi:LysR substrate-binding domain-containing protein [Azospirillum sp. sgz302134]